MSFIIIPNKSFLSDLKVLSKKYPSIKEDVNKLVSFLKSNPVIGESLGKDCYKIRIAIKSKAKGKSSGGRLITCVKVIQNTVYLLALYDKSTIENISDEELKKRLKEIKL